MRWTVLQELIAGRQVREDGGKAFAVLELDAELVLKLSARSCASGADRRVARLRLKLLGRRTSIPLQVFAELPFYCQVHFAV